MLTETWSIHDNCEMLKTCAATLVSECWTQLQTVDKFRQQYHAALSLQRMLSTPVVLQDTIQQPWQRSIIYITTTGYLVTCLICV